MVPRWPCLLNHSANLCPISEREEYLRRNKLSRTKKKHISNLICMQNYLRYWWHSLLRQNSRVGTNSEATYLHGIKKNISTPAKWCICHSSIRGWLTHHVHLRKSGLMFCLIKIIVLFYKQRELWDRFHNYLVHPGVGSWPKRPRTPNQCSCHLPCADTQLKIGSFSTRGIVYFGSPHSYTTASKQEKVWR